jgi:predicted nucleic acid-binding protein
MKVYLDTSVISALFDPKNPERKSLTEAFFRKIGSFEVYISEISIMEIERTPDLKLQNKMRETIRSLATLYITDKVEWLAKEYIRHGAVPEGYAEDSYHIAIAVLNEMDYLLSWNFKHIVRKTTRDMVRMVNISNKLAQIEIMTPAELL